MSIAAITDCIDGPLAPRAGRDARHAVLDVAADVTFVLLGLVTAATLELATWAAPVTMVVSVTAYVLASRRLKPRLDGPRLGRSRLGHAPASGIAY